MHYKTSGSATIIMNRLKKHPNQIEIKGARSFYLWGSYPDSYEIFIDEEFAQKGHSYVSGFQLEEKPTFVDQLITILTLGIKAPKSYTLRGYVK